MRLSFEVFAVVITGFVAMGCVETSVRQHKDLNKHLLEIDSVVIAPPAVSIEYVAFDSLNERLRKEEALIKQSLTEVATAALENHGFDVVDFDFDHYYCYYYDEGQMQFFFLLVELIH